jgi:hypothetical protein
MAFSTALYYPWIDVRDEGWLKTALLYWDAVRTIVPESIDQPYSNRTACTLRDSGFLLPLRVHSDMEEIEELTDDVLSYLKTSEGAEFLVRGAEPHSSWVHVEKLPYEFRRLADIHPEKLPWEIRHQLERVVRSPRRSEWLEVDERFADYYMTLLATRLSDRVGAALLTPLPTAERLALSAKMDAQFSGILPNAIWGRDRRPWEYDAMGPRRNAPRTLAQGILAHLALERVAVDPTTPIEKLMEFRSQHKDELAQFRMKVEQLTAAVNTEMPVEALRQRALDIYNNEVDPALTNLKRALDGRRIRWLGDGLLKIAFLSAGTSSMLVATGLSVPLALLAGAGLSLVVSGAMYNVDRAESLRNNPYSYLLAMGREFR